MKALKIIGWLVIPYIMIIFQWKKIGKIGKVLGTAWAIIAVISIFTARPTDTGKTVASPGAVSTTTVTAPATDEATKKAEEEAKAKKEAEAKAKADAEAKAKAEADAKAKAAAENSFVATGGQGVLSSDCFVATSEEAQDEMLNYINAKNKEALMNMAVRGQIFYAKKGAKITLVDRGILSSTIEVMETGQRGLVPSEFVSKK